MRTIHKFPLVSNRHMFALPEAARPVLVAHQSGELYLWVELETGQVLRDREFTVFGTGHEIRAPEGYGLRHIGSSVSPVGLVWHVYELVAVGR